MRYTLTVYAADAAAAADDDDAVIKKLNLQHAA